MRILTAIVLLLACVAVRADNPYGYVFTVSPNPVPVGASIGVTMETIGIPCVPLSEELGVTFAEGNIVYLTVPGSDGCDAVAPETRHYTMDALPPGDYLFRFYTCGGLDAETNEPSCFTMEEVAVKVLGLAEHQVTIPAMSPGALIGLAVLVAGLGASLGPGSVRFRATRVR